MYYYTTTQRSKPITHWIKLSAKTLPAAKREASLRHKSQHIEKYIYLIMMSGTASFQKGIQYNYHRRKIGYNYRWSTITFKRR